MTWKVVVLVLGILAIIASTLLAGLYLVFLRADRKKKDEEYSKLCDLLNKQNGNDDN